MVNVDMAIPDAAEPPQYRTEPAIVYLPLKKDAEIQGPELSVFLKNCLERLTSLDDVDIPLVNWHIFLGRAIEYTPIRDAIYTAMHDYIKPATANEAAKKLNLHPPKKKESRRNMYQNIVVNETCVTNYGRLIDLFYFLAIFPKHPQLDKNQNGSVKEPHIVQKWGCSRTHAIGNKANVALRFIHSDWVNYEDSPLMKQVFTSAQFYKLYPTLGLELSKFIQSFNGILPFFKVPIIDQALTVEFMKEMREQYEWAGLRAFKHSFEFAIEMQSLKISKINKIKKEGEKVLKLKAKLEKELGVLSPYTRLINGPLAAECNTTNYPNLYKAVMLYKNKKDPSMNKFKTYFPKKCINKVIILENLVAIEETAQERSA